MCCQAVSKSAETVSAFAHRTTIREDASASRHRHRLQLVLSKIAHDQMQKQSQDAISVLNKTLFRQCRWHHQPLTDFYMINQEMANRLASLGIYDLYGVALTCKQSIYDILGLEAKLLIEHAQGKDERTIPMLKAGIPNV